MAPWLPALLAAVLGGACTVSTPAVDLLGTVEHRLLEAEVGGQDRAFVLSRAGHPRRIHGVALATLPASPPSRLVLEARVPRGGRLVVSAGIPARYRHSPAVEFVVKVRRRGEAEEATLLSRLVDPANRPADRGWVVLEARLDRYAGESVAIVLETRGFEASTSMDRAYWGDPVIATDSPGDAPLVVVYLVDTLRADHLPLYGYDRNTAPDLARFARGAAVYNAAIASSSWTRPSVASLLTSLPPHEHGCLHDILPLAPGVLTVAEVLRSDGYATGAVVANPIVQAKGSGFDQGFSSFAAPASPEGAAEVVDAALAYLDAHRGLPTFLYVHTMDPHSPYTPPSPWDRRFEPPPAPGRAAADPRTDYREPRDRERLVAQYDGEIAYGDAEFGRFVRGLEERRLDERALVVFVADHGEEFLDHGDWMHGNSVFDELVRVPLVVRFPHGRHAGDRVSRQVELLDVFPTILETVGLPVPASVRGSSLEGARGGAGEGGERLALSAVNFRAQVVYGARTPTGKYVRRFEPESGEWFFDLAHDPHERQPLPLADAPGLREMKARIEEALVPGQFRYHLLVHGGDVYELRLRTSGWIEGVDAPGLGSDEHATVDADGRALTLRLQPRPGHPREVTLLPRPQGVGLWLDGTRGGRALRPADLRVGGVRAHPAGYPYRIPEVEQQPALVTPPGGTAPGLDIWMVPVGGRVEPYDADTLRRLRALGYVN